MKFIEELKFSKEEVSDEKAHFEFAALFGTINIDFVRNDDLLDITFTMFPIFVKKVSVKKIDLRCLLENASKWIK